ncbi:MAG: hypothetical protein AAFU85_32070 [Planctomycetota bacterium]
MPTDLVPGDDRMLAAMVPRGQSVWFFKVTAEEKSIELVEADLRKFVQSIQFNERDEPDLSKLPEGWRRGGAKRMRFASVDINTSGKQLDLSISSLPAFGDWDDYVKRNVDRWRGQLNLEPTEDKWSGGKPFEVDNATGQCVWVDLIGQPEARVPPPMPTKKRMTPTSRSAAEEDDRVSYTRPAGWRDGKKSRMRLASFSVGPEDAVAVVTVISAGGDERGNVARWMEQVLTEPPAEEAVDAMLASAESVMVSGMEGKRFVIVGNDPESPQSIDGTMIPLEDGFSMFIKMTGPSKTVASQSDSMRSFLGTLSFKNAG